jgi:hypothetical protein
VRASRRAIELTNHEERKAAANMARVLTKVTRGFETKPRVARTFIITGFPTHLLYNCARGEFTRLDAAAALAPDTPVPTKVLTVITEKTEAMPMALAIIVERNRTTGDLTIVHTVLRTELPFLCAT